MTTFKVGDIVRLPLEKPTTFMVKPGWAEDMNTYIGSQATIVRFTHTQLPILDCDGGKYYWHPSWLTLVSESTPEEPTNKVLARSLKLEKAFKDRQKKHTIHDCPF